MAKVYLVWNENRSECAGFTDLRDAAEAAGTRRVGAACSSLAEFFRDTYADEDIFEKPEKVFEIQEIDL